MIGKRIGGRDISEDFQRKKVAYIFNHHFFLGGGEKSFSELIRATDRKKFQPVVISPKKGEIEENLSKEKIKVFVTPFPSLKHCLVHSPASSLSKLVNLLRNTEVDIIHVNGSRACLYSGIAGQMLGVPVIWHVRETIRDFLLYDGFLACLAKTIICVSKGVEFTRFGRFGWWINKKIEVVYNGVDPNKFKKEKAAREKVRKDLRIRNEVLFGIVGNIIPLKGQDFFLRGLAKAKRTKPDLLMKTLIIGRPLDPPFNETVHRIVRDMNLSGDVIFRPYSEQITDIFSALDVFALPSRREGFSRSLLEAMSSGLPVLATRLCEIEEAAVGGKNAILVDFGDEERMASGIIKLCEDKMLRKSMGEKNRKRVAGQFDLRAHAKSVERIYRRLLSQSQ